eukprot:CAMPEP_0180238778 /NCGR_PEP_ID=MMETSP0987-20121128/31132_1 /TAXON_ID=697907 /ORGANISM="non described non described, Strain CCMP2293" /LENGTH=406 /DNA_ID=CAMNT_0022205369 /DNA_START=23 /DNA_END=1239 /DNA_ORIENTATION=+
MNANGAGQPGPHTSDASGAAASRGGGAGGGPREEWEDMDTSTYPALKNSFNTLLAAYRGQRATHDAHQLQWALEKKELESTASNMMEALQTVRDALNAETEAHDLDLQTLEALMQHSRRLQEERAVTLVALDDAQSRVREMQHQGHPEPVSPSAAGAGARQGESFSSAGASGLEWDVAGRPAEHAHARFPTCLEAERENRGGAGDQPPSGSLKSSLKKPRDATPPPSAGKGHTDGHKDIEHVFGHQRYDSDTDTYRLIDLQVENEEDLASFVPRAQLQASAEALNTEVRDLRRAYESICDENERLRSAGGLPPPSEEERHHVRPALSPKHTQSWSTFPVHYQEVVDFPAGAMAPAQRQHWLPPQGHVRAFEGEGAPLPPRSFVPPGVLVAGQRAATVSPSRESQPV